MIAGQRSLLPGAMLSSQAVPSPPVAWIESVPLAPYTTLGIGARPASSARQRPKATSLKAPGLPATATFPSSSSAEGATCWSAMQASTELLSASPPDPKSRSAAKGTAFVLEAGAGENWDSFVLHAVERGYAGLECLAGIPGDVGGTPVQNVGAYGQEVSETIVGVRAYDLAARAFVDLDHQACHFGYRRSLFNTDARGRYIVTAVTYKLLPKESPRCATLMFSDTSPRKSSEVRDPRSARCTTQYAPSASKRECWQGREARTDGARVPSSRIP